jgi:hypothetical protein
MIRSLFSSVVIIILSGGGGLAHDEIQTAQWEATTKRTLDFIQRNLSIPLPEWALRIPDYNDGLMNFTVSFLNFLTKERSCSLEGNIFGKNCGMCAHDCTFLREALGEERLVEDDPEVIILSPVMAERKRTDPRGDQYLRIRALLALPARPPGRFYLVQKTCARCLPNERDCTSGRAAEDATKGNHTLCRLLFRKDFIFADVDLGEHDLDDDKIGGLLRGVTLPTGGWTDRHKLRSDVVLDARYGPTATTPRHLVWLRGKCHGGVRSKCVQEPALCTPEQVANAARNARKVSRVRFSLALAFNDNRSSSRSSRHGVASSSSSSLSLARDGSDVTSDFGEEALLEWTSIGGRSIVECPGIPTFRPPELDNPTPPQLSPPSSLSSSSSSSSDFPRGPHGYGSSLVVRRYFEKMLDCWFSFCAHGDERWNLRFLELLSAGTIPVVVADGLTLPFAQLIPWETIVPVIPEALADTKDPDRILAPLRAIARHSPHSSAPGDDHRMHHRDDAAAGRRELLRRSATGLAVFQVYFSNPPARVRGLLASVGVILRDERARLLGPKLGPW